MILIIMVIIKFHAVMLKWMDARNPHMTKTASLSTLLFVCTDNIERIISFTFSRTLCWRAHRQTRRTCQQRRQAEIPHHPEPDQIYPTDQAFRLSPDFVTETSGGLLQWVSLEDKRRRFTLMWRIEERRLLFPKDIAFHSPTSRSWILLGIVWVVH